MNTTMMDIARPIPPSGSYISSIRTSCKAVREKYGVQISPDSLSNWISSLDLQEFEKLKVSHGLALPLVFNNEIDELNVISLLSILNFLHGYRTELKARTGRGAWDTITYFVISLYLSDQDSVPLSTKRLGDMKREEIAEYLGLKTHVEKQHETLPVMVGEVDQDVKEIVDLVYSVLQETTEILKVANKESLGRWMYDLLVEKGSDNEAVLEGLVSTFPAFRDSYTVDGQGVFLFKKALFLMNGIAQIFSSSSRSLSPAFPLPDNTTLPVYSDNVLPTMLLHHHILTLSSSSPSATLNSLFSDYSSTVPFTSKSIPNLDTQDATIIRASALDACTVITQEMKKRGMEVSEADVDGYLWSKAKVGDLRQVTRWVEKRTVMY